MGLAPAPLNLWPLAWVAIAPLWVLVLCTGEASSSDPQTQRLPGVLNRVNPGMALGFVWGIGYHGLALFWITGVHPMTWMGVPWLASLAIALFCWVAITVWGALIVAAWAYLWQRGCRILGCWPGGVATSLSYRRMILRVLMGTALWSGLEGLWSLGPLWWSSVAYTQSPSNLVILHLGQLSGPLTVTAALVAVNGLLAEAWYPTLSGALLRQALPNDRARAVLQNSRWLIRNLTITLSLFIITHALGLILYSRPIAESPNTAIRVGIIQGNIPNTIKLYEEGWIRAIQGYTRGYHELVDQGADVVLTPETALPFLWTDETRSRIAFYQAIRERGVPAWVGAFGGDSSALANSLFTVTGDGETMSEYRKVYLVPLGEYIPFEPWLGRLINRLSPLDAQTLHGEFGQRIDTPFGRAIVGICYDSAYANHFRDQAAAGGEFMITASNNAHYSPAMPAQHHALDVMRAIETDRWTARATNTGYSARVDPHGKTLWKSGINTYEVHLGTLHRRQTQTPYVRFGNWLTPGLFGILIVCKILEFLMS
jgi:apolipoprotein N-acyltransferase